MQSVMFFSLDAICDVLFENLLKFFGHINIGGVCRNMVVKVFAIMGSRC